jgi:transposase
VLAKDAGGRHLQRVCAEGTGGSGYFREEQEYGIKLHVRSVDKCLKRWGFTPQKPIKCA